MGYCFKLSVFFLLLHSFYMQSMGDNTKNIIEAIEYGNLERVKDLVANYGVPVNDTAYYSDYPYHNNAAPLLGIACKSRIQHENRFYIVKYLIEKGADTNSRGLYSKTPLHYIINSLKDKQANEQDTNVINYLLENGANPEIKDSFGSTPLELARNYDGIPYNIIRSLEQSLK